MLNIGCHLSSGKGFLNMGREALEINANTFQFFLRNPRGGAAKEMDPNDAHKLLELIEKHHFAPLLGHAPYTMNACSADRGLRELAERMMNEDILRMEYFPDSYYNFHPGSHTGQGVEAGIEFISGMLNRVLKKGQSTTVLLETMSGKGSEIGARFEELREIMDRVSLREKLGVCLDTCHVYSAGYEIVNHLDSVLDEFDKVIGLKHLKAIHLNDSMTPFGSKKDRHEVIGKGTIGLDAVIRIINHPELRNLPFYLETPNELPGYASEIKLLREAWQI